MAARTLVTIPISHYCEKARWALDRAGVAYDERRHLPGPHRVAVRRAGGGDTAPILVCEDGVLPESADIVEWVDTHLPPDRRLVPADAGPAAQARALAADYDLRLGPSTRRWVYHQLRDRLDLAAGPMTDGVPAWQRRSFAVTGPAIRLLVTRALDITPQTAAASERELRTVLDEVGGLLADGRPYLVGDRFTIADLTFAALCAPLVVPPEYAVALPPVEVLPDAMAAVVTELRAHPAGAHALAMFRRERTGQPAVLAGGT